MHLRRWILICSTFFFTFLSSREALAQDSFILDFPLTIKARFPSWFDMDPLRLNSDFAMRQFHITPITGDMDLAVTFYFTDSESGFLRVFWLGNDQGQAQMLCDNMYEGVGIQNQRTLLLTSPLIGKGGTLALQSGSPKMPIQRIEMTWLKSIAIKTDDPLSVPSVIRGDGKMLYSEEVSGATFVRKQEKVDGKIMSVAVTDRPQRIEKGVAFVVTLDSLPTTCRLQAKLLGVPMGRAVTVWVNGTPVNPISLEVPDMLDTGYIWNIDKDPPELNYVGWRSGVLWLPPWVLRQGDNELRFVSGAENEPLSLALKDLVLQLNYQSPPVKPSPADLMKTDLPSLRPASNDQNNTNANDSLHNPS